MNKKIFLLTLCITMTSYDSNSMFDEDIFGKVENSESERSTPALRDIATKPLPTFAYSDILTSANNNPSALPLATQQEDVRSPRIGSLSHSSSKSSSGIAKLVLRDTFDSHDNQSQTNNLLQTPFVTQQHSLNSTQAIEIQTYTKIGIVSDLRTANVAGQTMEEPLETENSSPANNPKEALLLFIQNSSIGSSNFHTKNADQQSKALCKAITGNPTRIENCHNPARNPLVAPRIKKTEQDPIKKESLFSKLFSCCTDETCE